MLLKRIERKAQSVKRSVMLSIKLRFTHYALRFKPIK